MGFRWSLKVANRLISRRRMLGLGLGVWEGARGGGVPHPPAGYAWVTYTDPDSAQNRIVIYTDPSTGAVRPVMASLAQ